MRWTQDVIDQVRGEAALGHTMKQAAIALNLDRRAILYMAERYRIRFHGQANGAGPMQQDQERARAQLAREVEAAKREAATAPLYRGWPP